MYNKISYNILFTMENRDDPQVFGVTHYYTLDQNKLDFATYEIGGKTILLGGSIGINKVVVLDGDIAEIFPDEIIEAGVVAEDDNENTTGYEDEDKEMEQKYSYIESFLERNKYELTFEPLSNYVDSILSSYDYSYESSLIGEGLEPAVIVENARRIIFGKINESTPLIPYLQRFILPSINEVRQMEGKNFGIAIYGDDHHVSAVLVKDDTPYVFDSTGILHQTEYDKTGIYKIKPEKLNQESSGNSVSLNPFGYKFQGEYSDVCGFWSSYFIAEAAKYDKIESFTEVVKCDGQDIRLIKPDFLIKVAANVIKKVDPKSITSERPAPERMKEYGKLGNFYIRKDSKAIKNKDVDLSDKDVELFELKKYRKRFNKLTQRYREHFNTLTQITTSSEISNLQNKKPSKSYQGITLI